MYIFQIINKISKMLKSKIYNEQKLENKLNLNSESNVYIK